MDNKHPQERLYHALVERLAPYGFADASNLADRLKLELDPEQPVPHDLTVLREAQRLLVAPMGGQDSFGDFTWLIEQGDTPGTLDITFEAHGEDPCVLSVPAGSTPEQIEAAFMGTDSPADGMTFDYPSQQDDEDYRDLWQSIATDCDDYIIEAEEGWGISRHPQLPALFLDAAYRGLDNAIADGIDLGIDPNVADHHGNTALHIVARQGLTHLIKPLIEVGARVDAVNNQGFQPLHLAAQNAHPNACLALLACHADPNALDRQGRPPMALVNTADHGYAR